MSQLFKDKNIGQLFKDKNIGLLILEENMEKHYFLTIVEWYTMY